MVCCKSVCFHGVQRCVEQEEFMQAPGWAYEGLRRERMHWHAIHCLYKGFEGRAIGSGRRAIQGVKYYVEFGTRYIKQNVLISELGMR